jgi:hypothetical protein
LVLFVEKTTQKYQFSISNIIFLDVKPKISGIKSDCTGLWVQPKILERSGNQ